jgi:hypothetical protein
MPIPGETGTRRQIIMSCIRRTLKSGPGGLITPGATRTPFLCFKVPATGSFTLKGVLVARKAGGNTLTYNLFTSGDCQAGTPAVPATAQSALCPTSPADGGVVLGFQPPGVSSAADGTGRFDNQNGATGVIVFGAAQNGQVPVELNTVGLAGTSITWSWNIELTTST